MTNKQQHGKKRQFRRHETHRHRRLQISWRKPRGTHNKMRKKKKGLPAMPNVGYRSPADRRHAHPSGKHEMYVESVKAAHAVSNGVAVRLASGLGERKRQAIREILEEKQDVVVINP